ncbi:MAG TPA: hypothetical protein PLJ26_06680, partial [Candidatus Omnitrophota bacterium]|nr:hypothetical protein [Candidatus Omnitrophota bacterium]
YDVTVRSSRSEALADAGFYAAQMMEEITARRFDEELNPPWTPEAHFGPETGESGWDAFDDVDDFDGYVNTTSDGFTRTVEVDYIGLNGTQWEASAQESDFKRVAVRVSKPQAGVVNVTMTTIIGRY